MLYFYLYFINKKEIESNRNLYKNEIRHFLKETLIMNDRSID